MGYGQYKDFVLGVAYRSGLFELGRLMRRQKLTILCYHRFSPTSEGNGAIPAKLFELHLRYLKKRFTIISFSDLSYMVKGILRVKNPLIITVDDGYRDFAEFAVPLLEKYNVPATLFVTTRFVDGEIWLWPDIVTYAVTRTLKTKFEAFNSESPFLLRTPEEKKLACTRIQNICKQLAEEDKAEFLLELGDRLDVEIPLYPSDEFQPVSWDDLRNFDTQLVEVGSHTVNHPILSRVSAERAQREIEESKEYIEHRLSREVLAFAYPNGMPGDYRGADKEALREAGYYYAVSCLFGFNAPDSDVFELKRITVQHKLAHFAQEVSGFVDLRERVFA